MKMKGLMSLFFVIAIPAFANDCSVSIESTDAMKYDKNEIVVKKSCKEFTVNLSHSGKLPKNVMGITSLSRRNRTLAQSLVMQR